jgi:hypothetical protein
MSSSVIPYYNGNFVIRDQMFLPFPIGPDRNSLGKFFRTAPNDVSPWIALDFGSVRTISAVQISQYAGRAYSGNDLNFFKFFFNLPLLFHFIFKQLLVKAHF